jgi:hypothetical protein
VITCCIQYTCDPRQVGAFEEDATRWPPIIERCGGDLVGYYLPKEGANNYALAAPPNPLTTASSSSSASNRCSTSAFVSAKPAAPPWRSR